MEQQPLGTEPDQATIRMDQHDEQQHENAEQSQQENQQQSGQQQQQQKHRTVAIIDGPSLAYHISAEYRQENSFNRDAEFRPSYKDIGARAVKFIEDMEAVHLHMYVPLEHSSRNRSKLTLCSHAIYFDGVLPSTKLEVRRHRLHQIMAQLLVKKDAMKAYKEASKKMPAPPFLVPVVLEALLASRFGNVVTVVPAEADTYCAEEAAVYEAQTGRMATIITNDSDLLVQASGAQTRIMLLTGLKRSGEPGLLRVEANVYFPAKIAASLGLDNLLLPAFLMNDDRHLTLEAAVAKSKRSKLDNDAGFLAFQRELQKPEYDISELPAPVIETLQRMDPRIAELAHQTMPTFPHPKPQPANMFLVPLIEDMGRQSAWVAGREFRNAAYRMTLSGASNVIYRVDEYTRRNTTCFSDPHPAGLGWKHDLLAFGQMFSGVREFLVGHQATVAQRFKYIAMWYTLTALARRGRLLSPSEVTRVLAGERLGTKEEMHASAMCQAAIYSFRILKQFLALERAKGIMDGELAPLVAELEEMPSLAELCEKSAADTAGFWRVLAEGLLETFEDEE
jgi:hypothetical protein